jgi:cyanate permease
MRAKLAATAATAAGVTIVVADGWAVAALGCVTILSVLAFIMWILSSPPRIAAVERLIHAFRDLFR